MTTQTQQRTFLTAEWKNLLMLNYAVDPALLRPFVPAGTELDFHEGNTYASLIGFQFNKTRLLDRAVPFHQSFEEVNLRFYVRRGTRRGVVFIRELVPKVAVTAIARLAYGENYSCVPMSHKLQSVAGRFLAEYSWGVGAARCTITATTTKEPYLPEQGSLSEFITEHYWGYAIRNGRTVEYQVDHPQWQVREADTAQFSGDGSRFYAADFARLIQEPPDSAFIAEGSAVTVFRGTPISSSQSNAGTI
ncbi:YqjF family protein [Occallatibacter savannae]|uniref:YqjF family protein n=1 Tax=Occallatibacter savannae TaxID=1002691 RepID=UPI001950C546|nr:DUF2071 domain-containing protein [Occallatibacter savannae]